MTECIPRWSFQCIDLHLPATLKIQRLFWRDSRCPLVVLLEGLLQMPQRSHQEVWSSSPVSEPVMGKFNKNKNIKWRNKCLKPQYSVIARKKKLDRKCTRVACKNATFRVIIPLVHTINYHMFFSNTHRLVRVQKNLKICEPCEPCVLFILYRWKWNYNDRIPMVRLYLGQPLHNQQYRELHLWSCCNSVWSFPPIAKIQKHWKLLKSENPPNISKSKIERDPCIKKGKESKLQLLSVSVGQTILLDLF